MVPTSVEIVAASAYCLSSRALRSSLTFSPIRARRASLAKLGLMTSRDERSSQFL